MGLLDPAELRALAKKFPSKAPTPPFYEFGTASPCGDKPPGADGADNDCLETQGRCDSGDPARGLGPYVAVWSRMTVDASNKRVNVPWRNQGTTCFPELVPGYRGITMAMIRQAFTSTEFTVATVNIQPEGDLTLVNLPTYFQTVFPEQGYGPEEVNTIDPGRMLGHDVQVRPLVKSVTYRLGGTTIGPTTSLGGPYPEGDVIATYTQPGTCQVRADITYAGQYRLDGGAWTDIPGQVTRQGAPVTLTVKEARARLYNEPSSGGVPQPPTIPVPDPYATATPGSGTAAGTC
jgi:hypothetical protein